MENDHVSSNFIAATRDWKEKSLNYLKDSFTETEFTECTETSSDLLKRKETIQKKTAWLQEEAKRIKKELEDVKNNTDENKDKYDLYVLATNLTWDLQSHPRDVKGYVSKPLNYFHVNTEAQSEFETANYLWKLISGDVKALSVSP